MNNTLLGILFSSLLCTQSINAGELTDSLSAMGMSDEEIVQWMEEDLAERSGHDEWTLFQSNFHLSEVYASQGHFDKALEMVSECISIGMEAGYMDSLVFRDAVNDKAKYLLENGQVTTAEKWVRKYIEEEIEDWRYVKLCFFYARVLETLGDLNLAESYLEKAYRISRAIGDDRYASRTLVRLSQLYGKSANYNSMLELYARLDSLNFPMQPIYKTTIRYNLSATFLESGEYEKALELATDVVQYGRDTYQDSYVMFGLYNKGYAERKLGMEMEALETFREAIKYEPVKAKVYNNLAEMQIDKEQYDEAIHYSELALAEAGYAIDEIDQNYISGVLASPDKHYLLTYMHDLGRALIKKGRVHEDPAALAKAIEIFELLDKIIDELRMTTTEHQARQFWREVVKPIYDDAIEAAYLLDDFDKAFYFAEKSKAILLLDDLVKNTSIRAGIVPDSLLNREYKLQQQILDLGFDIQESADPGSKDSLSDMLLELKRQLNEVVQLITSVAPQYAKVRYEPPVSTLDELRKIYKGKRVAISYIWAKEKIYRFVVGKDIASMESIEIKEAFESDLRLLQQGLMRPLSNLDEINEINAASSRIYKAIFPGFEKSKRHLTIFPDGMLYFLPFETLVVNDDPVKPRYLIQDHIVYYGYSVNTNFEGQNRVRNSSILLFAPESYEASMGLSTLNFYDHEMEQVLGSNTEQLRGEAADRENLLKGINNKKIIHIYSHAAANDTSQPYPWIAARNERIYLPEIYNLRISANLVILSACETNLGKEVKGEGVISLARGFFHAGAASVLASLWSVNDRSNSEIINQFYKYLKKGHTKAEAIRLSKLHYMEHRKMEARSPYYWAAVVYLGEDGKLSLTGHIWWKYALGGLLCLGLCGLGIYSLGRKAA